MRKAKRIVKAPPEKALEALCVGCVQQIVNQFRLFLYLVSGTGSEVEEDVFAEML